MCVGAEYNLNKIKFGKGFVAKAGAIIGGRSTGFKDYNDLKGLEIGDYVEVGQNSVIMLGVEKDTRLGNRVTVGSQCTVGHDDELEDNVLISSHSMLGGHVFVGKNAVVALGVIVRNRIKIGPGSFIGMGSVVVKDIPENVIAHGNPCRVISRRRKPISHYLRGMIP